MPKDATPSAAWLLEDHRVRLRTVCLQAEGDSRSLIDGFQSLRIGNIKCDGRIFQVTSPQIPGRNNPLAESYVREKDLVLGYSATPEFPFATQLDWRIVQDDRAALSIATIVSVQTDLLDTHPVIELSCKIPTDEVLLLPANDLTGQPVRATLPLALPESAVSQLVLLRIAGTDATYAEAIDPSDFCGLKISRTEGGLTRCTWRLFLHFLEKGVIRRSRLCSMLLSRTGDLQHAVHGFQDFMASELPLTA